MFRTAVSCLTLIVISLPTLRADNISVQELENLGLEIRWSSQAIMDVTRDGVRYITNDEANVYVQSTAGMLTAFHAENGRKLWNIQVGRTDEQGMTAVTNSKTILIIAGPVAYGFNKFNGTPLFEFRLPAQPSAAPAMNEGAFYIPLSGGAIYAYSLSVLEYKTRYGKLPDTVTASHLWRFVCAEEIVHPPVVGERALSFATKSDNLFSVETTGINRGKTRCQLLLNSSATANLAVADNKSSSSVVLLNGDNRIFSVDMLTGNTEWTYPMGRAMEEKPIIIGSHVYVIATDGRMVKIERDEFSPSWGRPVELSRHQPPMSIGVGLEDVPADAAVAGVEVKSIVAGSPGDFAGLQVGDIIAAVDGLNIDGIESAGSALAELPPRVERTIVVSRGGKTVPLTIKIPAIKWEAYGVRHITAVGRFGVYGIDEAGRLVGFDVNSSTPIGRAHIQEYPFHHANSMTDQIYLVSKSGQVICLREIGPIVPMPAMSTVSIQATVKSVKVNFGAVIDPAGTVICEVELPNGDVNEIVSNHKGTVSRVFVEPGQMISVGHPLIQIADDSFAIYHKNPQQRPIDVELMDPNAAAPAIDGDL